MAEEKINIGLYGAGTPSSRLRAEVIYCDRSADCSFYKCGKCLNVTSFLTPSCPYGRIERIDGGTKRAKSYATVKEQAKSNPLYGALSYPHNRYIADFGDSVGLILPWVILEFENDTFSVKRCGLGIGQWITIPKDKFGMDVLRKIVKARAVSLFGDQIKEFRESVLPMFFRQLKELFPTLYEQALKEVPEITELQPNYVGKIAYLSTVNRDKTYLGFRFEGDYMVNDNYKSAFLPFGAESSQLKIKLTNKMTVRITDNDQVLDTTRFV